MMKSRDHINLPLTINLLHGEGLKNVNPCTSMQVYVEAEIKGEKKKTIKKNGSNPIWNSEMKFKVDQKKLLEEVNSKKQKMELVLKVKSSSPFSLGHTKLGEVRVVVKSLYERVAAEDMMAWTSIRCPVVSRSRRNNGALYLSYRFGIHEDKVDYRKDSAVTTASAPPLPSIGLNGFDSGEFDDLSQS